MYHGQHLPLTLPPLASLYGWGGGSLPGKSKWRECPSQKNQIQRQGGVTHVTVDT